MRIGGERERKRGRERERERDTNGDCRIILIMKSVFISRVCIR